MKEFVSQLAPGNKIMTTPEPSERRSFFRVDQDVVFDYKQIDTHTVQTKAPEEAIDGGIAMHLVGELRQIDRETQQMLKVIGDQDRLLGEYLTKLNTKVDLIARHSMFSVHQGNHATRLNISEGGVAFKGNKALYVGNFLVLRMIFLPSYTPVIVFAKVIRCEADSNEYRIAATFHDISDQDRQELARQVMKAQVNHRKRSASIGDKLNEDGSEIQ